MPIYEFKCESCGELFEKLLPMGTAESNCPKCGGPSKKLFSTFASSREGRVSSGSSCTSCSAPSCTSCSG